MAAMDDLLAAEIAKLTSAEQRGAFHLSRIKSRIAHRIRTKRTHAMLAASGTTKGHVPAWLLSAHPLVVEWICWTSCRDAIVAAARVTEEQPLPSGRVELQRTVGAHVTTLRGGIYMGALTGVIELSRRPVAYYIDEPTPRIVIAQTELPEAVAVSVSERRDQSNRGWQLSDIIDHPFVAAYDPAVTGLANVDASVEVALEPGHTTLEPVPVAAMRVVPPDADPGRPWELTPREVDALLSWLPPPGVTRR